MVTKLNDTSSFTDYCSVLAKIHMVTKHVLVLYGYQPSSVLAKIHMVTKLVTEDMTHEQRSVLAKIHMVTKQ